MPEEIKKIREQYGLSQRSFAKLLNWGDKTICRYENGSIQDKAHNSLLLFLREPENMRTYLTENEIAERRDRNRQKLDSHEADLKNSKNDDASKLSTWINDNFRMQKKQEKNRKGNTDIFDVDNSTPSVSKEEEALIDLLSD